jgi:hypothetical protein
VSNFGHWSRRLHPRIPPSSRNIDGLVAVLAGRLTTRDRWLLRMLAEHRVFTTPQITALCFTSERVTRSRLQMLHLHHALHRARPLAPVGSHPYHWVLDTAGAAVLAAEDGISLKESRWRRDHAHAVLHSASLGHTVGVNGVFCGLVAHARANPATRLVAWWGERRCGGHVGDVVRPDGYAHWHTGRRHVEFFLEYDTGTESLPILVRKIDKYAELGRITGLTIPVLFVLPTARREANLRHAVSDIQTPAATTNTDALNAAGDASGPCWQPIGRRGPRLDLPGLADASALPNPPRPLSAAPDPDPAPDPTPPTSTGAAAA